MKKDIIITLSISALLLVVLMMQSARPADKNITKENGMYVVNTTAIGKKINGNAGNTPLKIYIKGEKIEKIEALVNQETPSFFAPVKKQLLNKWNGKTVKEAAKMKVDAISGATLSSNAVIKNVQLGLEYYQKNK